MSDHSPDCDTQDLNPDGIRKPCNCGGQSSLRASVGSAGLTPTDEHNVGCGDLTYRQAANAIWNKLNTALFLLPEASGEQALRNIREARALADLIVNHRDSGSLPNRSLTDDEVIHDGNSQLHDTDCGRKDGD